MQRRHEWTIHAILVEPDVHMLWVCQRCKAGRRWQRIGGVMVEVSKRNKKTHLTTGLKPLPCI